jgi:hypothetical protein
MHRPVFHRAGWALGIVLAIGSAARAVELESGPAFFTDSHGAAGVVMAMLAMAEADDDPKYLDCARQTLAWLDHVKRTDEKGRATWRLSESAPEGSRNRRVALPGVPLIVLQFIEAHRRTGRPEYKATALAAARWMAEVGADRWETPLGAAYGFGFVEGQKDAGLVAGHSHGLGKYLDMFLEAWKLSPEPVFRDAIVGILVHLKTRARDEGDGKIAWPAFRWNDLKDKDAVLTGYCYGQAGVVVPLMRIARDMPDLKLSDGTTPRALGNASLRYLAEASRPAPGGMIWPYMRRSPKTGNPGWGSGTGGIGLAFLEGWQTNRAAGDDAAADQCWRCARGAAGYALTMIEQAQLQDVFRSGGGDAGFGVCGGAGGAAFLGVLMIDSEGPHDKADIERARRAARRVADGLLARGRPVGNALAWPLNEGECRAFKLDADKTHVNLALDYGQTGVVLALAKTAKYLDDDEIGAGARKAADFVIAQAVRTDHGWKFPRFVGVEETPRTTRIRE